MEPRDFEEAIRRLVRTVSKSPAAEDIVAQLEALKEDAAPSEELLRVCLLAMIWTVPNACCESLA